MNKKLILGFILGILVSTITVYAVNYNAQDISFTTNKNSEVKTVKDALDDLYNRNTGQVLLWINDIGFGKANTYNSYVFNTDALLLRISKIDDEYFEINSSGQIVAKKDFKIKLSHHINPTQNLSYTAKIKTLKNEAVVLETVGGTKQSSLINAESDVIELKKGDILTIYAQGGQNAATVYSWLITLVK